MKVLSFLFICALSFIFAETLSAKNLPVPFTSQAPAGVWTQPWQDACEEAAIVMVDHFYRGYASRTIPKPDAAEAIGNVMCETLLLAAAGETFVLISAPIWVQPLVIAVSLDLPVPAWKGVQ